MYLLSLPSLPQILKSTLLAPLYQRFLSSLLHPLPFLHPQQSLTIPLLPLPNLRLLSPLNLSHLSHQTVLLLLSPLLLHHHSPLRLTTLGLTFQPSSFSPLVDRMVLDHHLSVPGHMVLCSYLAAAHGGQLPSCAPSPRNPQQSSRCGFHGNQSQSCASLLRGDKQPFYGQSHLLGS